MGKTLVINMKDVKIEGDVLDVSSSNNNGIIYSLFKDVQEEVAIDYVDDNSKKNLENRKYDCCTFFFNLSYVWGNKKRESIIRDISKYLKEDGYIYIWDVKKELGKSINSKVKIILPNDTIKEFNLTNRNPLISSEVEDIKKVLEKSCKIEETKVWEDVFYIKARKKE